MCALCKESPTKCLSLKIQRWSRTLSNIFCVTAFLQNPQNNLLMLTKIISNVRGGGARFKFPGTKKVYPFFKSLFRYFHTRLHAKHSFEFFREPQATKFVNDHHIFLLFSVQYWRNFFMKREKFFNKGNYSPVLKEVLLFFYRCRHDLFLPGGSWRVLIPTTQVST